MRPDPGLMRPGVYAGLMRKSYAGGLMRSLMRSLVRKSQKLVARGARSRDQKNNSAPEVLVKSYARSYAGLMRPQNPCRGVDRNPKVTHEMETGDQW